MTYYSFIPWDSLGMTWEWLTIPLFPGNPWEWTTTPSFPGSPWEWSGNPWEWTTIPSFPGSPRESQGFPGNWWGSVKYCTKALFLGMTAHWIEVKEEMWKLRLEVVGFKPISGDHSEWNLGQYIVGLCDRIGICNPDALKVGSDRYI